VARVSTLSALTASIAHEVNQPLSGIVTNASTCLRMLDADPPNLEGARESRIEGFKELLLDFGVYAHSRISDA
jgi:C4-dicarboxylate-specific signal transduction histidine kinase